MVVPVLSAAGLLACRHGRQAAAQRLTVKGRPPERSEGHDGRIPAKRGREAPLIVSAPLLYDGGHLRGERGR